MTRYVNYLTPAQVAELLMVSPITIRQWAQKGMLKSQTTVGGHRRYFIHEVERFARERGLSFRPQKSKHLRVLVVDDDRQFSRYLMDLLEWHPEIDRVEVSNNGFDAGVKIYEFKPHVILLDLMMPDIDGFTVCNLLKSRPSTHSIRVIAMTGNYVESNIQRSLSFGAEACLPKPINEAKLLELLNISEKQPNTQTVFGN